VSYYLEEMIYIEIPKKTLCLLKGQSPKTSSYEYLFVIVDDYFKELFIIATRQNSRVI
jgi:hypothetical protein